LLLNARVPEVLVMPTRGNAQLLDMGDKLGTIEVEIAQSTATGRIPCAATTVADATLPNADMQLTLRALTKTYPNGVKALVGIDLTIGKGLFGLLGKNGAGKSSLTRTIATLQRPDSGTITFGDIDVSATPDTLRRVLGTTFPPVSGPIVS
jgi:ABC-type bacteriocin/lantibiotic exporter with double-glycine peptidase domain